MADTTFNIRITAVDKATQVINRVNNRIGKAFRPYEQAKRSAGAFFDALGKNDLVAKPLWALEKIGAGVTNLGASFGIAESSVLGGTARIASSLGMVGGPFGAFAAGTVVVGGAAAAVGVKMGQLGFDIERTARSLGMSTERLQEYRGAAKLAGLSTEAMDSSLGSLAATLTDAAAGRNPQAQALLDQFGISVKKTKDGAVDVDDALRRIANSVSRLKDPNMQRKAVDILGLQDTLTLLREGEGAMVSLMGKARQLGYVMGDELVKQNKKQADSWNETKTAVDSIGISLGNIIAKYVQLDRVAEQADKWAQSVAKSDEKKKVENAKVEQDAKTFPGARPSNVVAGGLYDWFTTFWGAPTRSASSRVATGKVTEAGSAPTAAPAVGVDSAGAESPAGAGRGFIQPRGIRNNNPGNLNYAGQAGATKEGGPGGRFATFETPELGITAMAKNLMAYQDKYAINTVSKIVSRWAPASDGNNVAAYVAAVSKQTGFKPDESLDLKDPKVLAPLISAITKHENGQNPYSPETIAKAIADALSTTRGSNDGSSKEPIRLVFEGLPHGMTVKAVRGLGQSPVGMSMLPGGQS
ncbi:hypothetical protein A3K87_09885 [Variovorax paradoxus]|uniref:Uncharacterized protein n=1 Tax=Variovorax paradoxus TaxID=34073 RepID=A0AA91DT88_VARPD|nr:hypothetical protein [Variovorax paradoxus]OAK66066.1 hypothetical protein A3K87_09885 [Variovorax paradoxus]